MYLVKTGKKPSLLDFSLTVINQMIVRFGTPTHMARSGRSSSALANPIMLTARYFPSAVPPISTNPRPRRICHVCRHTNRQEKKNVKVPIGCVRIVELHYAIQTASVTTIQEFIFSNMHEQ